MAQHLEDQASGNVIAPLAVCRGVLIISLLALLPMGELLGQVGEESLSVTIDIKPGDAPTRIEATRGGMIPVAVLTTPEFDASRVEPATVRMGPTGTEAPVFRSSAEDADEDGDIDLLLLFRVQEMKIECRPDATLNLTGKTRDGQQIEGKEAVKIEGCK